jgi:DNA replication protein DnaC
MTEERIIDKFSKCPWLGIDDLGSSRTDAEASAFTLSVVYEIVNNRYSDKLPLVVTTNKNLSALGREFDARIMSRIKGMCKVLEFKGSDRRQ